MKLQNLNLILAAVAMLISLFSASICGYIAYLKYQSYSFNVVDMPPLNIAFENNLTKLERIKVIMDAVANERPYVLNKYDCTQFSTRLSMELKYYGINAYCKPGQHIEQDGRHVGHTWVEVNDSELGIIELESTGGYVIDSEIYSENYRPFNSNVNGVCY